MRWKSSDWTQGLVTGTHEQVGRSQEAWGLDRGEWGRVGSTLKTLVTEIFLWYRRLIPKPVTRNTSPALYFLRQCFNKLLGFPGCV